MTHSSISKWLAAAALVVTAPLVSANQAELDKLIDNPNYWATPSGNLAGHRYTELDQITNKNADKIQTAWTFSTGVLRGHEGGPLVLPASATGLKGDTLFIHAAFPNNVFAINLDTLEIVWEHAPQQDYDTVVPVMCCDTVNRGLSYGDGKIMLLQADMTLKALDASSGEVVWSVVNGQDIPESKGGPLGPEQGATNTQAPLVVKDKVMVGCSGAEFGVRCWMAAYNLDDGSLAWRAFSMGPDEDILVDPQKTTHLGKPIGKDSSLKTWCAGKDDSNWTWNKGGDCAKTSDQWKTGGGSVWGFTTADTDLNLVYYGTGNPSTWNPVVRPGDNKWSMTMMARDIDTGMAKWFYQMTPHDEWDYDGVNEMILVDMKVKGKERQALVHFDRNGFAYTMDRVTGELLVAEKYDPAVNWATHVDMKTGRPNVQERFSTRQQGEDTNATNICPAALGSKDQQPAAYSPRTGLFYVPTNHVCMNYEPVSYAAGGSEYVAGQPYVNAILSMFPAGVVEEDGTNNLGNFIAWDADKGKIVWSIPEQFSVWSGVLATAGDVAFYGTLDGYLKAVDAKSGKLLWKFKTPSGIIGNTNAWAHNGKQYVGVLSGLGGWAGIGFAAGLEKDTDGLGAVGAYKGLDKYSRLGGTLSVFSLP
ncbi:PQQ-dependent dehydrogenase (methanol/ethanol family) [Methylohalomonas lacus]|uniref:PQQ-dependent dehydrogenase (Methanol/ethanol family) n=1 Tax=Methylohalomonas lacus TaxID=398773 RepID=A0AAE3HNL9_9GAMM|nr:PQQ-dependent dehydrogenase, methanol/ethanol family [Methylohalomonas lacus]MCS3904454.1 PQQ-dependent dehydrogenase (methanol/ethanol family) [Methylohalomonas lacus]